MTDPRSDVLFVGFNQDSTSLAVGTKRYYKLYSITNGEELKLFHEQETADVCLVERLFSSSLVTLVSLNAARKLRVMHFAKGTEICTHSYNNSILAVKMNRLRVVVCLENALFVHNIRDMKVLHKITDTPPNYAGVCDLSASDNSLMAYPGSAQVGQVHIYDANSLEAVTMLQAHDSPLAAVKFSNDGTKIATASEKGTVIRVFLLPKGERIFEFRRGMKRCVAISSLAFNEEATFLAAASNTETIHIFKLDYSSVVSTNQPAEEAGSGAGWMDYASKMASAYLPQQMSEMLNQDRAFATARLPVQNTENNRTKLAITKTSQSGQLRVLAATTDGYIYIYSLDARQAGLDCVLLKQHRYISGPDIQAMPQSSDRLVANAVSSSNPTGNSDQLHINDENEFPPMEHSVD